MMNTVNMSLGTFIFVEHCINFYKLKTFINNEPYGNVINMSLGTFIYIEHYMNVMNMFLEHYIKENLKTFINEKHLGHMECYEHVFMRMLVSNI